MIARKYIGEGFCITLVLGICGVPKSTWFSKPNDEHARKGVAKSSHTLMKNGEKVENKVVIADIKSLLSQEFVDYGYLKVTYHLRDESGYRINHKKVYRLMKEAQLLNISRPKPKNKKT